ncbi:putative cis-zeatin O-glucosyltransferase [Dendrobium catenatum]|uniref:putative cis-zeatin O-glucosyltransferase n=1 Tax=Dendrobium catenatum TaxID=906689 RepID=UPI00109F7E8E|nr:putative cis-zeatin O-glucosyltransferase [Dendrobium catenatum]
MHHTLKIYKCLDRTSKLSSPFAGEMSNADEVTVVIVPFPAHGHLNQLLHLSLLLSTRYGLTVHFASTASHNRQAKLRLQGWPLSSLSSIHFHDLPLPPIPSPPPNPHSPNSFPTHLQPLFEATDLICSALSSLFLSLSASSRRLVVIHDHIISLDGFEATAIPNGESYAFRGPSAAFHFEAAQLMKQGAGLEELSSPEFIRFIERRRRDVVTSSGFIMNTCREVESEFLDILTLQEDFLGKPIFAIGPLNPMHNNTDINRDECLEWLDGHPPCSVVYVSFGTMSTISDEQAEQLAYGLRRSGHRFLWVLRDADRADIFAFESSYRRLPAGFEKAVEGVGKVVRGWVPQLDVLAHRATGGFMSHCGWNSCMEAVSCGVPVMAWPMHSDQPANARLLAEGLKVGVVVRGWDRRREVVPAERVEEVVRIVLEGEEGRRMREKAREMGETVRAAQKDGGSSKKALDVLVAHWRR